MNTQYPLTLLYDAACPVCGLEMDHLRQRNAAGRLAFVNIAAPGFDAAAWGATMAALDAEIHGVQPDGSHLVGLEALRAAYAAVGLGWVLKPTGWGPLAPLADAGYRAFARHRRPISRAAAPLINVLRSWRARRTQQRMARCQAGACQRKGEGG
jgi:predicted DCC family thiol-disulfide oxidoreductase YuxK